MGAYLSQPITDKDSSDGEDAKFKYGTTAMQGWRTNMEVRAISATNAPVRDPARAILAPSTSCLLYTSPSPRDRG